MFLLSLQVLSSCDVDLSDRSGFYLVADVFFAVFYGGVRVSLIYTVLKFYICLEVEAHQ